MTSNDQIKEDEIDRARSTYGRRGMHVGYWRERQKEMDHKQKQVVGGWTILSWILERYDIVLWTGWVWLGIGTNGKLLRIR
jgi:hypothetical protein